MVTIRPEVLSDVVLREALLERAFGCGRNRKTSQRFREGRLPADGLAFTALGKSGRVIGTLRMWNVIAGSAGQSLMLGPLAIDARYRGRSYGTQMMEHALNIAKVQGHRSVILVGDEPYYGRFGFSRAPMAKLHLPGPVDRSRLLGLELVPGTLDAAEGLVMPCGVMAPPNQTVRAA